MKTLKSKKVMKTCAQPKKETETKNIETEPIPQTQIASTIQTPRTKTVTTVTEGNNKWKRCINEGNERRMHDENEQARSITYFLISVPELLRRA